MRRIEREVPTFLNGSDDIEHASNDDIRKNDGYRVDSYSDLVERVAEISYRNPEYVLLFRGQRNDYVNRAESTSLHSKIFRTESPNNNLMFDKIRDRFERLKGGEKMIKNRFDDRGQLKLARYQILRWAILQHYSVCRTPLLDVTNSLHVACSFAHMKAQENEGSYLYVLGMPQISGSVTTSSEQGVQLIRLASICPPKALRPHFQEGYLAGEFPTITVDSKQTYDRNDLDVARRLVCIFRLPPEGEFWGDDFSSVPDDKLFPNERDDVESLMEEISNELDEEYPDV